MIAAFVVVKRDIVDGLNGHRYLNELLVRRLDHADRSLYAKRLLQVSIRKAIGSTLVFLERKPAIPAPELA